MKSIAVVRADDIGKVRTALRDLLVYARVTFECNPRILDPDAADNILVHVMKKELKEPCEAAAIVPLLEDASTAIGRIRKCHPPAHIVIVSPMHEIFQNLSNEICMLAPIALDLEGSNHE